MFGKLSNTRDSKMKLLLLNNIEDRLTINCNLQATKQNGAKNGMATSIHAVISWKINFVMCIDSIRYSENVTTCSYVRPPSQLQLVERS
jgi:hypothetical protein